MNFEHAPLVKQSLCIGGTPHAAVLSPIEFHCDSACHKYLRRNQTRCVATWKLYKLGRTNFYLFRATSKCTKNKLLRFNQNTG